MPGESNRSKPSFVDRIRQSDLLLHVLKKLVLIIPLLLGVVTLLFTLIELSPGSVIDKYITQDTPPEVRDLLLAKWRLDQSPIVRYFAMLGNMVMLDFGVSIDQERPVFEIIGEALPNTLVLSGVTFATLFPFGITLGIIQSLRQGKPSDTAISMGSLFFYSMPSFWLALMLQLIFSLMWPILPSSQMVDPVMYDYMSFGEQMFDRFKHLILPGFAMGLAHAAGIARYMRSSMLEVVRQDFIRTARAKGLSERVVMLKHALRNALLPVITIFGLSLPAVFSGSVLVETIFAWPGMGRTIVGAIFSQDTPLIIACFFVFTLVVVIGNLLSDIFVALADPRIRFHR